MRLPPILSDLLPPPMLSRIRHPVLFVCVSLALAGAIGCVPAPVPPPEMPPFELIELGRSQRRWTGVAVSREGRVFLCFPRWSDDTPVSVVERLPSGRLVAYPGENWNRWEQGLSAREHFVCVQSVVCDADNHLWILDTGNPKFEGVLRDAAKLVRVDLVTDRVTEVIPFNASIASRDVYLNDVRIDTVRDVAYLTDSGKGALIAVNLRNGRSKRLLGDDRSTRSEDMTLTVEGHEWRNPDGTARQVHADGLALDDRGEYVYYHALTARMLYRIPTRYLLDRFFPESRLGSKVERVGLAGATDGLLWAYGRVWLTSLEENAIEAITPGGVVSEVVRDARLGWPDSLALGPDGSVYVTTSQIHWRGRKGEPECGLFRLRPISRLPETGD